MSDKMLVVDDDGVMREAFSKGFSGEGYQVLTASNAEEALEIIAEEGVISVVFLDLNLPGMNGIELCREIKKRNPVSCVFAVTGHSTLFELADCREVGFEDYFTKPARMGLLFHAAQQAFERVHRWKSL